MSQYDKFCEGVPAIRAALLQGQRTTVDVNVTTDVFATVSAETFTTAYNDTNVTTEALPVLFEHNPEVWAYLKHFAHFLEYYVMIGTAAVGILCNILCIAFFRHDKHLRKISRCLQILQLVLDILFLILVIVFVLLRHDGTYIEGHRREALSLVTLFMAITHCLTTWNLYIVATDAFRALRHSFVPVPRRPLILVFILSFVFFIPFVPYLRVYIFELDPLGYDPCTLVLEELWDFVVHSPAERDLYYILYYTLAYVLFVYLVPFLMIAARDKDLFDLLEAVQDENHAPPTQSLQAANTVMYVSVFCNAYLLVTVPKMILLIFYLFNFATPFLSSALPLFGFVNELANWMLVLRPAAYMPLLLLYDRRLRDTLGAARRRLAAHLSQRLGKRPGGLIIPTIKVEEV